MSKDGREGGRKPGLGLQCPFSKCFPQLFDDQQERALQEGRPRQRKPPCTITAFNTFREVIDHIWKYHSSLLSCNGCDHRFVNGKRREQDRPELDALKEVHMNSAHSDDATQPERHPDSQHAILTMNDEQDTILGNWKKSESGNDKKSAEKNYMSLCRSLFGNDVQVPETAGYNYYVPYYKTNKFVEQLGERNIRYVEQNRLAAQLELSAGSHQPSSIIHHAQDLSYSQNTINPLLLDEAHHPQDWAQPKTIPSHDSGYDSMPPSEHVRHADGGPYMDPSWSFGFGGWQSNENVTETGAYFHNAIQPRADEVELDWEPGSSDGPAG